MEGVLWKWTNYWNGWQTRWFILENGVLSYYKSEDEVNQGCKGSTKVSSCQINVNALDATRLDVIIPGDQRMYLRAATQQDRQKWLVALGSAKACMESNQCSDVSSLDGNPTNIKTKLSELRLYCDIMMQQVHAIKSAVACENGPEIQKLDDTSGLLSATCDSFIQTLEDCMKLSNSNHEFHPQLTENSIPPSVPATLVNGLPKSHSLLKHQISRSSHDVR